jgi:chorismate mutase
MVDPANPVSKLRELRDSIDNIDAAIIHMLAERFRSTRDVGKLKAQHGLPARDPAREAEQVSRLRHLAVLSKLDPDFAEKLLFFVVDEVVRQHETVPRGTTEGSPRNNRRFPAEQPKVPRGTTEGSPRNELRSNRA